MVQSVAKKAQSSFTVFAWAAEINRTVTDIAGSSSPENKIRVPTLYAYLNGTRNITGKGARSLAMYFHGVGDFAMVDAITQVTLGIPYPVPERVN